MKLTIELVPSTSHYKNLRKMMKRSQWDKLRKEVYAEFDHKCGICGSEEGRLNCHEIWEYDDQKQIQKLNGFIALCSLCHHIKHLGLASILVLKGRLDGDVLEAHFLKVNECDLAFYMIYADQAFRLFRVRSQCEWTIDLGDYEKLLE